MIVRKHDDIIEFLPVVHTDQRGHFLESYNSAIDDYLNYTGLEFIQDNISVSKKGVLRGLHFQKKNPQGKLVTVIKGSAIDVLVDLRQKSKSFGKVHVFHLGDKERNILWIPPGFAHGFQALDNDTIFFYKVTAKYEPEDEYSINPLDKTLSISWNSEIPLILSEKDRNSPSFKDVMESIL